MSQTHVAYLKGKMHRHRIFIGSFISFSFPCQGPWLASFYLLPHCFQYLFNRLQFIDYGLVQFTQQTIQFLAF